MFEALFILTTVDNGTRVARYQIGDLLGNVRKLRKFADPTWRPGNLITTFIATALWGTMLYMGVSDANGGINAMVPIFGISKQWARTVETTVLTPTARNAAIMTRKNTESTPSR